MARKIKKNSSSFRGSSNLRLTYSSLDSVCAKSGNTRPQVVMDWIELMFWGLQGNEGQYLRVMAGYDNTRHPTGERPCDYFSFAVGTFMAHMTETNKESLGDIFMEFCGYDGFGQFFTPSHLSNLLADLTISAQDNVPIRISDPSCGAGGMLVAAMKNLTLKQASNAIFVGQDLDHRCCYMTALNLTFFNMNGLVVHGDSLKVEVRNAWETVRSSCGGILRPYSKEKAQAVIEGVLRYEK